MYLNPYYRHIADLKREMALNINAGHMRDLINMLGRKTRQGNLKAAKMLMDALKMQKTLDIRYDDKHEMEVIMGAPTDGLMKTMRPGGIVLYDSCKVKNDDQSTG